MNFRILHYLCTSDRSGGGIGRHAGLKIPWTEMSVRVRFPSGAREQASQTTEWPVFIYL